MPSEHALSACVSRFLFQFEKSQQFLTLVAPVIPDDDNNPMRQYLYKSTILMVQSFFEEYLRCIVATATFYKTAAVRLHLAQGQSDPDRFAAMTMAETMNVAQDRVNFERNAAQLKRLFQVLTGGSPFADADAEQKCLDFANVRNIIAHVGGWPTEAHIPVVTSPNVIVVTNDINGWQFVRLEINRQFFGEALLGMYRSVAALEARVASDRDFSL